MLPQSGAAILEQLDRPKAIFAALQINRLWANKTTTVLWRGEPPIKALAGIEWNTNPDNNPKSPTSDAITLEIAESLHERLLLNYLQSKLQTLERYGWSI